MIFEAKKRRRMSLAILLLLTIMILILVGHVQAQSQQVIDEFFAWADELGAEYKHTLQWPVNFPDTGRGVAAVRDLTNQVFLRVPFRMILSGKNATGTPYETVASALSDFQATILMLIIERLKGPESYWAKYIQTIPPSFETTASWSERELLQLEDDYLIQQSQELRDGIRQDYYIMYRALRRRNVLSDILTIELYQWAWFAVGTRCFIVAPISDYCLVPIADLLNHQAGSDVGWRDNGGFYEMYVGEQLVPKGFEIFNNYGTNAYTNSYSMLHYGFTQANNQHNQERISFRSGLLLGQNHQENEAESTLNAVKQRALEEIDVYYNIQVFPLLRTFQVLSETQESRIWRINQYSWEIVQRSMQRCEEAISQELSRQLTINEEYARLFGAENFSTNFKSAMATRYRIERKVTLLRNKQFCEFVEQQLLPCVSKHAVLKPKFNKALVDLALKRF